MPMPADEIETLIRQGIPDARVEIIDLAGDGDHYEARVIAESFRGISRGSGSISASTRRWAAGGGRTSRAAARHRSASIGE